MNFPIVTGPVVNVIFAKKRPTPLRYLAYLKHYTGSVSAPNLLGTLDPGYDPSAPDILDPAHNPFQDAFLKRVQEAQDIITNDHRKRKVRGKPTDLRLTPVAVVDLTVDPNRPGFAGCLPFASRYPASIGKLACMLGAFQLQFDLQVLASMSGATSQRELFELAREEWGKTQTPAISAQIPLTPPGFKGSVKKVGLRDHLVLFDGKKVVGEAYPAPNLERIFDPKGSSFTDFMSTGESFPDLLKFDDPHTKAYPGYKRKPFTLKTLGFRERMDLMIGLSHNEATASCVRDIGFLYINSILLQSGIYSLQTGGLWMANAYNGNYFHRDPVAGQSIGATPASLVNMFTLMFQNKLVNKTACDSMRRLLHKQPVKFEMVGGKHALDSDGAPIREQTIDWFDAAKGAGIDPGTGTRSPVQDALAFDWEVLGTRSIDAWSKLGLYKGVSDVALIEHVTTGGQKTRFAVSSLKDHTEIAAISWLSWAAAAAVADINP